MCVCRCVCVHGCMRAWYIHSCVHVSAYTYGCTYVTCSICAHQCQCSHTQLYVVILIHRNQVNNVDELLWSTGVYHTILMDNVEATAIHT